VPDLNASGNNACVSSPGPGPDGWVATIHVHPFHRGEITPPVPYCTDSAANKPYLNGPSKTADIGFLKRQSVPYAFLMDADQIYRYGPNGVIQKEKRYNGTCRII
jgi:hypothetical protein